MRALRTCHACARHFLPAHRCIHEAFHTTLLNLLYLFSASLRRPHCIHVPSALPVLRPFNAFTSQSFPHDTRFLLSDLSDDDDHEAGPSNGAGSSRGAAKTSRAINLLLAMEDNAPDSDEDPQSYRALPPIKKEKRRRE